MNRFVFIICLFCFWVSVDAQNLIYNGSFEEYYSCPVSNDLGGDLNNSGQLELAKGWWKPTLGTSDYFNACNTNIVGVPTNFWGYQAAYDGVGYIGAAVVDWDNNGNILAMEYVQTELMEKLEPCSEYLFSMYVSLADKSEYGVGNLSAFLGTDSIELSIYTSINLAPTFLNFSPPIIDTQNWTLVSGTFVAKGNEKYLTIGYKGNEFLNDTTLLQEIFLNESVAYYYIDYVSLVKIGEIPLENCSLDEIQLPNIFTPNNDGLNDYVDITDLLAYNATAKIVNRWGNVIAELDANNTIWNGDNLSDGVYFYFLEYSIGNKEYKQNGFIQLLR